MFGYAVLTKVFMFMRGKCSNRKNGKGELPPAGSSLQMPATATAGPG